MLTIILPTYKDLERPLTKNVLDSLSGQNVIVVDTPSQDGMKEECQRRGFKYLESLAPNRAGRLNDGLKEVKTDWVLFHHPRSLLDQDALISISKLPRPCWGAFTHKFDYKHPLLKFTSFWSNHIRGRLKNIYYLDHCLFSHRDLLQNLPRPFGEVDVFEDTIFCKKLKQISPPIRLKKFSTTSAIRFIENGFCKQAVMNQVLKIGYLLDIDHKLMNRIYEKGMGLNQRY